MLYVIRAESLCDPDTGPLTMIYRGETSHEAFGFAINELDVEARFDSIKIIATFEDDHIDNFKYIAF